MTKTTQPLSLGGAHALSLNMPLNNNPQWRLLNRIEKECVAWQGTFDRLYFEAFTEVTLKSISTLEEALRQSNHHLKQAELNAKLLHTVKTNLKAYGQATKQIELGKRRLTQFNALSKPQFWEKAQATIEQSNGKTQDKRLARLETLQSLIEDTPYPLLLDTSLQALLESEALLGFQQQLKKYQALLRNELKRLKGSEHRAQRITTASMLAHLEGLSRAALEQEACLKQGLIERVLIQQTIQNRTRARADDVISYVVQELHDLRALTKEQQKNPSWAPVSKTEIKALTQQEQLQFKRLAQQQVSHASFARLSKIIDSNQFTVLADEKVIIPRDMEGLLTPRSGLFASLIDYVMGWRAYGELDFFKTKTPELLTYNQWLKCTTQSLTLPGIEENAWLLQLNTIMAGFDEDAVKNNQHRSQLSRFASAHHRANLETWGHCIQSYQAHVIARGLDGLEQMFSHLNKTDALPDKSIQAVQSLLQHFQRCMDSQSASLAPHKLKQRLDACEQQITEKIHYDDIRKRWSACTTNIAQYCDEMNRGIYLSDAEWKDVEISSSLAYELGGDYWEKSFVKRFQKVIDNLYARSQEDLERPMAKLEESQTILTQHITQIRALQDELSKAPYHDAFDAALKLLSLQLKPLLQRRNMLKLPDHDADIKTLAQEVEDFFLSSTSSREDKAFAIDKLLAQLQLCEVNTGDAPYWQRIAKLIQSEGREAQKVTLDKVVQTYWVDYCRCVIQRGETPPVQLARMIKAMGNAHQSHRLNILAKKREQSEEAFLEAVHDIYYQVYTEQSIEFFRTSGFAQIKTCAAEQLHAIGFSEEKIDLFFESLADRQTLNQDSAKNKERSFYADNQTARQCAQALRLIQVALDNMTPDNVWSTQVQLQNITQEQGWLMPQLPAAKIDISALLVESTWAQMKEKLATIAKKGTTHQQDVTLRHEMQQVKEDKNTMRFFINELKQSVNTKTPLPLTEKNMTIGN